MALDATFYALIGLVLFFLVVAYFKVPVIMLRSLDSRADQIRDELAEAKRLREEAQHVLADYQRKRREAEDEAKDIVAAAEREAQSIKDEARRKTEEYVERRTAFSEQKIRQAEHDAIEAVRSAAVDVAVEASRIVLEKKATAAVQSKLFSKSIDAVKSKLN
ncbi:F0F1 ATP synthase subunit B [Martelella endophytica]|uniref:F0F1 ATP synthase subunit B n=1 Tax=Martelella endophytica TaxID=1486262 RepID=UPI001184D442|nr:F0F1 ATP synthase subunit B [Martelella endophytica]